MEKKTYVKLDNQQNVIVLQENTARRGYKLKVTEGSGTIKARGFKPNTDTTTSRIQIIKASETSTKGTFKLKSGDAISSVLSFDSIEADYLTALRTLPGYESALIVGTLGDSDPTLSIDNVDVPFGTPKVEVVESTLIKEGVADAQKIVFTEVPAFGAFALYYPKKLEKENATPIFRDDHLGVFPYSVSTAELQTRLRYYFNDSGLTVTGDTTTGFVITHSKTGEVQTLWIGQNSQYGFLRGANGSSISFSKAPLAGTFKAKYDGEVTADLAFDISAANLQIALRALGEKLSDVVVTLDDGVYKLASDNLFALEFEDVTLEDAEDDGEPVEVYFSKEFKGDFIGANVEHTVKGSKDKAITFTTYNSQEANGPELSDSFTTELDRKFSGMQGKLYLSTADSVTIEVIEIF